MQARSNPMGRTAQYRGVGLYGIMGRIPQYCGGCLLQFLVAAIAYSVINSLMASSISWRLKGLVIVRSAPAFSADAR